MIHGDTDNTPYGLGTYGSRSTPVSGAAAVLVARKLRDRCREIAAHLLEVSPADLDWERGTFSVRGVPGDVQGASITMREIAAAAYGDADLPEGLAGGLEDHVTYSPENLTYPFGAYICVVDIDPGTAVVKVRRFIAVDDCGTRINEMIVEGQIHRGLTDGVGMALMEQIGFDEHGNCLNASLMDYLIPTALEVPDWETGDDRHAVAAPPDRRQGGRRVRDGRLAAGGGERGHRRAGAVRCAARRHAAHSLSGLGGHADGKGPEGADPMTPTQLRAFAAVVRLGSVKAAAAELLRHRGRRLAARRPAPQGARRPALHAHLGRPGVHPGRAAAGQPCRRAARPPGPHRARGARGRRGPPAAAARHLHAVRRVRRARADRAVRRARQGPRRRAQHPPHHATSSRC